MQSITIEKFWLSEEREPRKQHLIDRSNTYFRPSEIFLLDQNWHESVFVGEPFDDFYSYPEIFIVDKDYCSSG